MHRSLESKERAEFEKQLAQYISQVAYIRSVSQGDDGLILNLLLPPLLAYPSLLYRTVSLPGSYKSTVL